MSNQEWYNERIKSNMKNQLKNYTRQEIVKGYVDYFTKSMIAINIADKETDPSIPKYRFIDIEELRKIMDGDTIFDELLYPLPFKDIFIDNNDPFFRSSTMKQSRKKHMYYMEIDANPYFRSTILDDYITYKELNEGIQLNISTMKNKYRLYICVIAFIFVIFVILALVI